MYSIAAFKCFPCLRQKITKDIYIHRIWKSTRYNIPFRWCKGLRARLGCGRSCVRVPGRVKPKTNIDMCCFSTSQHIWYILKTGGLGIRIIYSVEWCATREVFHQWASTINKSNNKITELRTILQSKIKVSKST